MPAAPPQVANFIKDVVALKKRVRNLELAALRKSASTLKIKVSDLVNAKVFGAVNHQVFTYMDGDWVPRGGNVITQTYSDSGTGTVTILEDLIDPSEWPADQVWLVTAKARLGSALGAEYQTGTTPVYLGIASTGITLDDPADPSTLLTFTGGGFTVDFPVDLLNIPLDLPRLAIALIDDGTPQVGESVDARTGFLASTAWLFAPGATPQIFAELTSDPDVYPAGATVTVEVRLYPLP
jgi:hypothetical protein